MPRFSANLSMLFASDNVALLFDIYHAQPSGGEIATTFQANIYRIGHIQIDDNPGRHAPGTGELNFAILFEKPASITETGLHWLKAYGSIA